MVLIPEIVFGVKEGAGILCFIMLFLKRITFKELETCSRNHFFIEVKLY